MYQVCQAAGQCQSTRRSAEFSKKLWGKREREENIWLVSYTRHTWETRSDSSSTVSWPVLLNSAVQRPQQCHSAGKGDQHSSQCRQLENLYTHWNTSSCPHFKGHRDSMVGHQSLGVCTTVPASSFSQILNRTNLSVFLSSTQNHTQLWPLSFIHPQTLEICGFLYLCSLPGYIQLYIAFSRACQAALTFLPSHQQLQASHSSSCTGGGSGSTADPAVRGWQAASPALGWQSSVQVTMSCGTFSHLFLCSHLSKTFLYDLPPTNTGQILHSSAQPCC